MVPYFSLFDTFMDQTQDSSKAASLRLQIQTRANSILNKTGFLTLIIKKNDYSFVVIKRFLESGRFVLYFVK